MKTIIAPTDFSTVSYNACLFAAKMAADINAKLVLLHAMELPVAVAEFPASGDIFDEAGAYKELAHLKKELLSKTSNKINIITKNVVGYPDYEIKELCKAIMPFAIVMATHTYSVIDRFFLGSTTLYAARHLRYPVIIVPAGATYKPFKKIAFASDLKNIYDIPVSEIENIVKLFDADFEVFYVGKNNESINRNTLGSLLLDHRLQELNPHFYMITDADVLKGVAALAEKHSTDLLIVIPRKHGPFHKSRSNGFVLYSDVPVMAIHENDDIKQ